MKSAQDPTTSLGPRPIHAPVSGGGDEELVNWDGVLSPDERGRILARIRSAFAEVGTRIPDFVEVEGRKLPLRETVLAYLERERWTRRELGEVDALCAALEGRVAELERSIREGDIDEASALALMREALGILRALSHLRKLGDAGERSVAKEALMSRVEDERRWLRFVRRVRG